MSSLHRALDHQIQKFDGSGRFVGGIGLFLADAEFLLPSGGTSVRRRFPSGSSRFVIGWRVQPPDHDVPPHG